MPPSIAVSGAAGLVGQNLTPKADFLFGQEHINYRTELGLMGMREKGIRSRLARR